jgi:hypothetical protein
MRAKCAWIVFASRPQIYYTLLKFGRGSYVVTVAGWSGFLWLFRLCGMTRNAAKIEGLQEDWVLIALPNRLERIRGALVPRSDLILVVIYF